MKGELSACMVPADEGNPYQASLARGLEENGVRVRVRRHLKGLVSAILRREEGAQVIHLHWLPAYPADLAGAARAACYLGRLVLLRLLGRRLVWTVHNLYSHESKSKWMERWVLKCVLRLSHRVLVHSPVVIGLLKEEFGYCHQERIVVVPHGNFLSSYPNTISRAAARAEFGFGEGELGYLFLGNIRPYKGVAELIKAYRGVGESESFLLVAGKPLSKEFGERLVEAAAVDERIRLHPRLVADDAIQTYMNASDVVVFPYEQVLTSGAVILAMSFGKACVAPNLGCIPDTLDAKGAFLYDPDDPGGLPGALREVEKNRDRLAEMGRHNLNRAREWGWDRIGRETREVYEAALGRAKNEDSEQATAS